MVKQKFKRKLLQKIEKAMEVEQWEKKNSEVIRSTAREVLGESSGKEPKNSKES